MFLEQQKVATSQLKDADFIFREVWSRLVAKYGEEFLAFPKDIMWLAGAPGAGKGQMTPMILEYRGLTAKPLEVGSLFSSEEAKKIKAQGKLVGDQEVVELLFEALLKPEHQSGLVVDGFPRSPVQAECIKLLYDQMLTLHRKYSETPLYPRFRRPIFHVTVLYIDKQESIRRQLHRGKMAQSHNDVVLATGVGSYKTVRETDLDPELAARRYDLFQSEIIDSLKIVKEKFHFHFISAEGSIPEVQERIIKELQYQSSLELGNETFERVRQFPLASEIILNARTELVRRLDVYRMKQTELFDAVIEVLKSEMLHIVKRQALSGRAIVRSNNPIFAQQQAIDMALDILTERGFQVVLDLKRKLLPVSVDLKTGQVISKETRVYEFQIEFPRPTIRRG